MLWPNLQLLSLLLLNVIWGCAARPGYFSSLGFYKSDGNGLVFPNPWSLCWACTTEVSRRAWAGPIALLDNDSAGPQKVRRHQLEQKMASQPLACNSEKKERSISLIQIFSFDSSSWCFLWGGELSSERAQTEHTSPLSFNLHKDLWGEQTFWNGRKNLVWELIVSSLLSRLR